MARGERGMNVKALKSAAFPERPYIIVELYNRVCTLDLYNDAGEMVKAFTIPKDEYRYIQSLEVDYSTMPACIQEKIYWRNIKNGAKVQRMTWHKGSAQ